MLYILYVAHASSCSLTTITINRLFNITYVVGEYIPIILCPLTNGVVKHPPVVHYGLRLACCTIRLYQGVYVNEKSNTSKLVI